MLDHVAIFQVYFQHFFMPIHVWKVVSPCKFTSRLEDELTVKFRLVFYTWSLFMMRFFRFEGHITCLFFSDSLLSFCGRSLLLAMIDEETSRSPKHPKAHCTTTKVFEVWSYLFFWNNSPWFHGVFLFEPSPRSNYTLEILVAGFLRGAWPRRAILRGNSSQRGRKTDDKYTYIDSCLKSFEERMLLNLRFH